MGKLEGRTALITGASRGIGRAIAERFAREGTNVAINYTSNEAAAQEVAEVVEGLGGKAHTYRANVGDELACTTMIEAAARISVRLMPACHSASSVPRTISQRASPICVRRTADT
jgi:NAD(P)-dependent dehydrogenase (short-subunit alcohol dehydrogenase family)